MCVCMYVILFNIRRSFILVFNLFCKRHCFTISVNHVIIIKLPKSTNFDINTDMRRIYYYVQ